jgi:pyrroloquinoline-quinone synthase
MKIIDLDSKWDGLIEPSWITALDETPFLTQCREGRVAKRELASFVRQQYYYSRHFTRYLCALISNLRGERDRVALSQNLFEEMGLGKFGSIPHSRIYREMMEKMGIESEGEAVLPSTHQLINLMFDACRDDNPIVGLGALCLGAEAIVPHIYCQIMHGFECHGEPSENLEFFQIHIEGDDEHALTMREIIERELKAEPLQRAMLRQSAHRLIEARASFFEGITYVRPSVGIMPRTSYDPIQL